MELLRGEYCINALEGINNSKISRMQFSLIPYSTVPGLCTASLACVLFQSHRLFRWYIFIIVLKVYQ